MTTSWLLAADIGGTNLRLRAYHGHDTLASEQHETAGPGALAHMFGTFASAQGCPPDLVVAAVAGPVTDNRVQLTNAAKSLCGRDLQKTTGAAAAYLINDFAAASWSTALADAQDLMCLQGAPKPPTEGIHVVIGPGTGLGVGTLIYRDGVRYAVPGEGGHVGIAPASAFEVEVFAAFHRLWPHVFFGDSLTCEAEAMLSGTGLPMLYRAVQEVMGDPGPHLDARGILTAAQAEPGSVAAQVAQIFKSHLARLAGDLGLAAGADSVFLVGGVATKNQWLFDDSFVAAFCAGGRFTGLRERMNLYLLRSPDFGLLGARNYAIHMLGQSLDTHPIMSSFH